MMQIMNNIKIQRIFEKIMPLCLALFFARTVFIGYKYLFFAFFVPCFLYSVYVFFKQGVAKPKSKILLLPVLVITLFGAHFSLFSNVVKESVNIALIVYFVVFSNLYYADDSDVFLKWIVRLTLLAGVIAILRSVLSMFGLTLPHSSAFFEGERFSLVRDNNFYSYFFIVAIIITARLLQQHKVTSFFAFLCVLISIINIGASVSRRACALYLLLVVALMIISVSKKGRYGRVFLYNVSILFAFLIVIIGTYAFFDGLYTPNMSYDQKYKFYKLHTLIDKESSFVEFDIKKLRKYYSAHKERKDSANLFWDDDLKNCKPWDIMMGIYDDSEFHLIEDKNNYIIELRRSIGYGEFQIWYTGRPIMYYGDVSYEISFLYRIIEGPENPFYVGWWVNEGHGYQQNLPQKITPIDSVWKECKVSYKFRKDHINTTCFLNTLSPGSTIEVKNIRMTCDDTTGLPRYVDQLPDSVIHNYYSQDTTIDYLFGPRTARWRYALDLWQTRYNTKQKIFGQGFKYLEWYGEKFYNNPNRHDFPHNPIISSFLYSGIIGGIVYIIFLIMSLWLYWKKRKTMGIFFIMYLCCMFFSMFSGSSHFSFPLFAFLSFLPFVEYKNDNNSCEDLPANG